MSQHRSICAKRYLRWLQQHNHLDGTAGTAHFKSAPRSLQLDSHISREQNTQRSDDDGPSLSQNQGHTLRIVREHIFDARLTGDALTCALMFFEETDDIEAYEEALVAAFRLYITFGGQGIRPSKRNVRFDDLSELALLIGVVNRDHASINTTGGLGMTILHLTCAMGLADLLEPLFWRGASFDAVDHDGATPLTWAVKSGDPDTVLFALALGADPRLGHPVVNVSLAERRDAMTTLAESGAHNNEALVLAIEEVNLDVVRSMLSRVLDPSLFSPNVIDSMLDTISQCDHWNSENCVHEQIALTLLGRGVKFRLEKHFDLMLHFAVHRANVQLLRAVLNQTASPNALNVADKSGRNALFYAVRNIEKPSTRQRLAIVSILVEAGADINARNDKGSTALNLAARDGNEVLVELLLDARAKVNTPLDGSHSAMMPAAGESEEGVRMLADVRADVNSQDDSGNSALIVAAEGDHIETVRLLLDAGADTNLRNKSRETALSFAAVSGHESIVQLLLDAGADVDAQIMTGDTALSLAAKCDNKEVVRILLAAGARVDTWTLVGPMRTFVETILGVGESGSPAWAVKPVRWIGSLVD
jgi:ankyrin repeat protein